jgi:hypothetical protein
MRLIALVVTVTLSTVPRLAAGQAPSAQEASASTQQDKGRTEPPALNLPVSVDKIREALQQPPVEPLKGLDEHPQFRVEIQERLKLEELIKNLKIDSGPAVPGGLYGYEQQQVLFPKVDNPLVQPYAAFSQTELLTVAAEALAEQYLARRVVDGFRSLSRAAAEAAARQEVERAIAEYCAAQENHGAGIRICEPPAPTRP